ncbi:MAG: 50S ribosomal protein L35ae [Candidatus Micrarchaeota archaeon]
MVEATIINYRRGTRTEYTNQFVVEVEGVKDKEEAKNFVGKKIVWKTSSGKEMVGKLTHPHGNSGAMLARFEKGLPGQAVGTKASVVE